VHKSVKLWFHRVIFQCSFIMSIVYFSFNSMFGLNLCCLPFVGCDVPKWWYVWSHTSNKPKISAILTVYSSALHGLHCSMFKLHSKLLNILPVSLLLAQKKEFWESATVYSLKASSLFFSADVCIYICRVNIWYGVSFNPMILCNISLKIFYSYWIEYFLKFFILKLYNVIYTFPVLKI
jgi:hypothetical protein